MAEPSVISSLNVFLNFDFAHQDDPALYLGVAKNQEGLPYLITLSKHDKQVKKECNASLSLKNVVRFILRHQEALFQESGHRQHRLEYQLAWLERKIKQRNDEPLKREVVFENPSRWKLIVKIIFPNAFEEKCQQLILSKNFQMHIPFDRLTTQKYIHDKIWSIVRQDFQLKVKCTLNKCCVIHNIQVNASDLFRSFVYGHESLNKEPYEPFLSLDQPGDNEALEIKGLEGDNDLLKTLIQGLHQTTRVLSSSSKGTLSNSRSSLISSSSASQRHAGGLHHSSSEIRNSGLNASLISS